MPRFLEWVLVSTFVVSIIFYHIGWSTRWLSQTILVFKLAHNYLTHTIRASLCSKLITHILICKFNQQQH
jgi:uncharacterized membrane protein YphA (DoxX/SURF4 family)